MIIQPKINSRILRVKLDSPLEIYLAEQQEDFPEFLKSFLGISDSVLMCGIDPLQHNNQGDYYFEFDMRRDYTSMISWIQKNSRTFSVFQKRELLLK